MVMVVLGGNHGGGLVRARHGWLLGGFTVMIADLGVVVKP
jgi:hypothetical protein